MKQHKEVFLGENLVPTMDAVFPESLTMGDLRAFIARSEEVPDDTLVVIITEDNGADTSPEDTSPMTFYPDNLQSMQATGVFYESDFHDIPVVHLYGVTNHMPILWNNEEQGEYAGFIKVDVSE